MKKDKTTILLQILEELKGLDTYYENKEISKILENHRKRLEKNICSVLIMTDNIREVIGDFNLNENFQFSQTDFPIFFRPANRDSVHTIVLKNDEFKYIEGLKISNQTSAVVVDHSRSIFKDEVCFCPFSALDKINLLNQIFRDGLNFDFTLFRVPIRIFERRDVISSFKLPKKITGKISLYLTGKDEIVHKQWNKVYKKYENRFFSLTSGRNATISSDKTEVSFISYYKQNKGNFSQSYKLDRIVREKKFLQNLISHLRMDIQNERKILKSQFYKNDDNINDFKNKLNELKSERNKRKNELFRDRKKFITEVENKINNFVFNKVTKELDKEMKKCKNKKKFTKKVNSILENIEKDFRVELTDYISDHFKKVWKNQIELLDSDLNNVGNIMGKIIPGYNFEGNLAGLAGGGAVGTSGILLLNVTFSGNIWNLFQAGLGLFGLHGGSSSAAAVYSFIGGSFGVTLGMSAVAMGTFWLTKKMITKITWKNKIKEKIKKQMSQMLPEYKNICREKISSNYRLIINKLNGVFDNVIKEITDKLEQKNIYYSANRLEIKDKLNELSSQSEDLNFLYNKLEKIQ